MTFLGIKYEPLSDPPSLKFVSGVHGAKSDVLLPFNLTEVTKMCFCCFKRSLKQTVHLSDRSLSDWAIQFRAIVF